MFDPNLFLNDRDPFETDGQEHPFMPPEMAQFFMPGMLFDQENPDFPKREEMMDNFMIQCPDMEVFDPNLFFMLDPSMLGKDSNDIRRMMPQAFDYFSMLNSETVDSHYKMTREKIELENQFLPKPQILYDSTRKIGTLTHEERQAKVKKYLEKRKTRTFSKRIAYACRKRVADTRIRIKGRFVTKVQAEALKGLENDKNNVSFPLSAKQEPNINF